jgi:succinate dehydrogenase / fumarate reductase cytochrome b subunit
VYRWQITMTLSILHRATGVALAVGAFALAAWLVAASQGAETYASFQSLAGSLVGRIALAGFAFCLIYHLLNGIRHLLWDVGYGYEIPKVYATGWTVVALSLIGTLALWYAGMYGGGAA